MPVDWISILHRERPLMNRTGTTHTEATKANMREVHKEVSQRPEVIDKRSQGGFTSWLPEKREDHRKAIKDGIRWKRELERQEQEARNEINRARVQAHLQRTTK